MHCSSYGTRESNSNLIDFVEPAFVRGQLGHEGLVLEPLAVQVAGLIVGRVLSCQHLLVDPESQLEGETALQESNTETEDK